MKLSRTMTLAVAGLVLTACTDASAGIELRGIWFATSHEYESATGEVVDIIARDGASTSLTIQNSTDGVRVTASLDDGMGDTRTVFGVVEGQRFRFGAMEWSFQRTGEEMTVTRADDTFDFGAGPEPAELTIRLMRL